MSSQIALHTAPAPVRFIYAVEPLAIGMFICGGFSSIVSFLFVLGYAISSTNAVDPMQWAWLGISLLIFAPVLLAIATEDDKHTTTNTRMTEAYKIYGELNKDHKRMAKPVLDKMAAMVSLDADKYDQALYQRLVRLRDLRDKQVKIKATSEHFDDSDLAQIVEYIDNPALATPE